MRRMQGEARRAGNVWSAYETLTASSTTYLALFLSLSRKSFAVLSPHRPQIITTFSRKSLSAAALRPIVVAHDACVPQSVHHSLEGHGNLLTHV